MFRHGARGPLDGTWDKSWGDNYGELTQSGMRQEFIHGAYIGQLFPNLFSLYDPETIYVRSTNRNRTLMSAYSLILGLYDGKGSAFPSSYPLHHAVPPYPTNFTDQSVNVIPDRYQPLPIHTVPPEIDQLLLSYTTLVCPLAAQLAAEQLASFAFQKFWTSFEETIAELSKRLNLKTSLSALQLIEVFDTVHTDYYQGKQTPGNIDFNSELGKNLTFLFSYISLYAYVGTIQQQQLFSMNPLNQFESDLEDILRGSKQILKLYSAHDSTMLPILSALKIVNYQCVYENFINQNSNNSCYYPKYASGIRIELRKNKTDIEQSTVRVFYDEIEQNVCRTKIGHCIWSQFKQLIRSITRGEGSAYYNAQCHHKKGIKKNNVEVSQSSTLKYVICVLAGAVVILFLAIVVAFIK